jgi:hypothetical protein
VSDRGLEQVPQGSDPSRHWKLAWGSPAKLRLVKDLPIVPVGASVNAGAEGATLSTVQLAVTVALLFPARSTWRTATDRVPSASPVRTTGETQLPNGPPSIEHWKTDPASALEIETTADVLVVNAAGLPESEGVRGGVASTIQEADAAGPVFPAASVCLTAIE